jgi:hypothetical protein
MALLLRTLAYLPLLWLALATPAGAQDLSPELAADIRTRAEAALITRLTQPGQQPIPIRGNPAVPSPPGPEKLVFIGVTQLPSKAEQQLFAQAQFLSYADATLYQVVVRVADSALIEISAVRPGHPRLAEEEIVTARNLVETSTEGARILAEFPGAQIDFTVTSIADPGFSRYGHRLLRVLFHQQHHYLSTPAIYADLTTMELITEAALTSH